MESIEKIEKLVVTLNNQSLKSCQENSFSLACSHLSQALQVLDGQILLKTSELYWLTYFNYGIVLKRQKNYAQALEYFLLACEYIYNRPEKLAECYLNACNILSKNNNHKKALKLALKSVEILKHTENKKKVLAFQYAGAEYEYMSMKTEALEMYESGYFHCAKLFGFSHPACEMFKRRSNQLSQFPDLKKPFLKPARLSDYALNQTKISKRHISGPIRYNTISNKSNINKRAEHSSYTPSCKKAKFYTKLRFVCNSPYDLRRQSKDKKRLINFGDLYLHNKL